MSEGYLALATGPRKYVDLAMNLAASIKVVDPERRVCLVHDKNTDIPDEAKYYFDDFVVLADDPSYRPILNKLRLYHAAPYERFMFVDADCMLTRDDISTYWDRCAGSSFAITGESLTTGRWKGNSIPELMQTYGAKYVVKMNSGVFYAEKCQEADAFFSLLNDLHSRFKEQLIAHDGPWKYEDELFFGVAMGIFGMAPKLHSDAAGNTIMATTWRAPLCLINPETSRSILLKPTGFWFEIPVLPRGFRRLSPTFMHFVGLRPRWVYHRVARRMRELAKHRPVRTTI